MTPAAYLSTVARANQLTADSRLPTAAAVISKNTKVLDQILGRNSMLGAFKALEEHRKFFSGGLVTEAISPKFSDQTRSGLAAIGSQALANIPPPVIGEITPNARLRVTAEPFVKPGIEAICSAARGLVSAGISQSVLADQKWRRDLFAAAAPGFDATRLKKQFAGLVGTEFTAKHVAGLSSVEGLTGLAAKPLAIQGIATQLSTIDQIIPRGLMQPWRLPDSLLTGVDTVRRAWERHDELEEKLEGTLEGRLIFLLDHFSYGRAIHVMERLVGEGIDPMLDLLETVLITPDGLDLCRAMVAEAPDLREQVRDDLKHGIDHVSDGDYKGAFPPLFVGLEGAFRDAARAKAKSLKRRTPRFANARSAIMKLELPGERSRFLEEAAAKINPGRHGEELDRRAFSLLSLIAVFCVYDEVSGEPAVEWLSRQLSAELERRNRRPALN